MSKLKSEIDFVEAANPNHFSNTGNHRQNKSNTLLKIPKISGRIFLNNKMLRVPNSNAYSLAQATITEISSNLAPGAIDLHLRNPHPLGPLGTSCNSKGR